MTGIGERFRAVEQRVSAACARADRARSSVQLVAVSKFHPASAVQEAYDAGAREFGENYPQELRDKADALARLPELRWHAIGRLQRNKVPLVARHASVFHALDDLEIARALGRRRLAEKEGAPLACYVQVSFGEDQKGGVAEEALTGFIEEVRGIEGLELLGLMGLPPLANDAEASRPYFVRLRTLGRREGLPGLSMGMTGDFEVAIEEGATCLRIGTAIFGDRPPRTP